MNDIKYELIIYWSVQDDSFIVEVPELAGCMADGETYEEAVANGSECLESLVIAYQETGEPLPQPTTEKAA